MMIIVHVPFIIQYNQYLVKLYEVLIFKNPIYKRILSLVFTTVGIQSIFNSANFTFIWEINSQWDYTFLKHDDLFNWPIGERKNDTTWVSPLKMRPCEQLTDARDIIILWVTFWNPPVHVECNNHTHNYFFVHNIPFPIYVTYICMLYFQLPCIGPFHSNTLNVRIDICSFYSLRSFGV